MKNAIQSNLQMVLGNQFIIGVLTFVLIVFLAQIESLIQFVRQTSFLPYGYHNEWVHTAIQSDAVISFVPILSVLPLAGSFVDDVKSRYAYFLLIRSDWKTYLICRVFVCFLYGGMVITCGVIFAWICATLIFLPRENLANLTQNPSYVLLKEIALLFLNGGLWAIIGITTSTIMESKYIAYASPFITYYLLIIVYERYLQNCHVLYPKNWIKGEMWPLKYSGASIFLIELTLVFSIIFVIRAGRRLREL